MASGPRLPDPRPALAQACDDPVLHALAVQSSPSTVPQLAQRLGVHVNTVRTRLSALIETGLADREAAPATGRGRPSHVYEATAQGRAALSGDPAFQEYRGLTGAFAEHLARHSADPAGQARAVGHAWGMQLARPESEEDSPPMAVGEPAEMTRWADEQTVALLERLQFSPQIDRRGVALLTCPLLELASQLPDVVCRVHLGLVEGALERYGSADRQVELVPFAEPGACRLRLHPAAGTAYPPS